MEYSDIISVVRKELNDPNGNRWSDEELKDYSNVAQRRYVISSLCLDGTQDYVGDSNLQGFYRLPDDFLDVIRFTVPEGNNIELVSFDTLDYRYTGNFLYSTTKQSPLSFCLDFGSWNEIRFYPNPESGVAIGTLHYKRLPKDDIIEVDNLDALSSYVLFLAWAKEGDKTGVENAQKFFTQYRNFEREALRNRKKSYRSQPTRVYF